MPVERQVLIIYAGTNGFLDKYPVERLLDYERQLVDFVEKKYPDIFQLIVTQGKIDDALKAKIETALKAFDEVFAG
jgi:F-type H+-transporting ATPase subunit alpha